MERSILFLSLDLSCAGQMAEAIAKRHAPPSTRILSAAVVQREIPPAAREALKELGLDMPAEPPIAFECVPIDGINLVVVLGEAGAAFPDLPAETRIVHWPIPDARSIAQSDAPLRAVFRFVRDELEKNVVALFFDHWRSTAR